MAFTEEAAGPPDPPQLSSFRSLPLDLRQSLDAAIPAPRDSGLAMGN